MGIYINKGNEGFRRALNGEYVDKTGMIEVINKTLDTERSFTCVTVKYVQRQVMKELREVYPDIKGEEDDDLMELLIRIKQYTGEKFIVLIDEWDAICREFSGNPAVMDEYVKLLRRLFKGGKSKDVFAGAYLTGILPIKKYNTQSALNNVREYSVVEPGKLDKYFGFTPKEISDLVKDEEVSEDDLKAWYDGYSIGKEHSMYNPYSVMEARWSMLCQTAIGMSPRLWKIADLVFIPRRNVDKPAMVVELKYNKDAVAAIDQIKQKNYPAKVAEYMDSSSTGEILLVGINYDKESKTHTCKIEHYAK